MEINLETKVLWYSIELTSCIGTKHKIKLQASKYVDIAQQHKRTQFLLNETRNIMYNLETNELEICIMETKTTISKYSLIALKMNID